MRFNCGDDPLASHGRTGLCAGLGRATHLRYLVGINKQSFVSRNDGERKKQREKGTRMWKRVVWRV